METNELIKTMGNVIAQNTIRIDSEKWQSYIAKKKQAKALEKETKAFEDANFPNAKEVGEKRQLLVVNGNGQPIGKVSIYKVEMPPQPARESWIRRIT